MVGAFDYFSFEYDTVFPFYLRLILPFLFYYW